MTPVIFRHAGAIAAFEGADGARIQELAGRSTGLTSHSIAVITHPRGTSTVEHHHAVADEVYYVRSGRGRVRVDDETFAVGPGDTIIIRPGQRHKVWAEEEDLTLVVTCAPAFDAAEVRWDE